LLAWDRALGLDFRSYLDFVNARPVLIGPLAIGYRSIAWQILGIMIVLPLAGYYRRSAEAICAFTLALVATTCISALVPAIGVYGMLDVYASDFPNIEPQGYYDTLHDAPLVRAGILHGLNLSRLVGILTFPSFHAASAALYIWAFSPLRWLRLLLVPCNILMIAASPVGGGHYFVDVFAGIAVSAAAIVVTLRISYMVAPKILAQRCRAASLAGHCSNQGDTKPRFWRCGRSGAIKSPCRGRTEANASAHLAVSAILGETVSWRTRWSRRAKIRRSETNEPAP
jgi:membrane-associated phospholipid phosphatase